LRGWTWHDFPPFHSAKSPRSIIAKQPFLCHSLPLKILAGISIKLDHPVFALLDFATLFFTVQGRQPLVKPLNLEDQVSALSHDTETIAGFTLVIGFIELLNNSWPITVAARAKK
jgi:hypothetical protein